MKGFIQEGDVITLIAPYAVASGAGMLVGRVFGVAQTTVAISVAVEAAIEGVFDLAKATGLAWTQGVLIYWDDTAKNCTTTVATNRLIGAATNVSELAGATSGRVYVDGAVR